MKEQGGKSEAWLYLENILRDYQNAASMFKHFRGKARRNAANLDFWLEGVAVNSLRVRRALAVLNKSLSIDKKYLWDALDKSRRTTNKLFARSYPPKSVKTETDMRYGLMGLQKRTTCA